MIGVLVGLVIFVLLIVVHEYGHFLAAKLNGVEVEEFGVGFPPKIAGKTFGKGIFRSFYTLNLIPLGGFVRLKGETETDKRKGSFGAASFKAKILIAVAGVVMNFLVAILIFSYQAATGIPQFTENQFSISSAVTSESTKVVVVDVSPDSPASSIGIDRGSVITTIDGSIITTDVELTEALAGKEGTEVEVEFKANGRSYNETTILNANSDDGLLGVIPLELTETTHSLWAAPLVGVGTTAQLSWLTVQGIAGSLGSLLTGDAAAASENIAGPVGIFSIFGSLSDLGLKYVLYFGGVISLTLAVMNILPLPALDGGRLAVSILVNGFGVKISETKERIVHLTGFVALLILAVLITIVDIGRF